MTESLNQEIQEYRLQLQKGYLQKAYKGIMAFMSELKTMLGKKYPEYIAGALYLGFMDMTASISETAWQLYIITGPARSGLNS